MTTRRLVLQLANRFQSVWKFSIVDFGQEAKGAGRRIDRSTSSCANGTIIRLPGLNVIKPTSALRLRIALRPGIANETIQFRGKFIYNLGPFLKPATTLLAEKAPYILVHKRGAGIRSTHFFLAI